MISPVLHLTCSTRHAAILAALLAYSLAAQAQLNDTGVTRNDGLGADHQYGRDAAAAAGILPKAGSGSKGFDFTKIANDGSELPETATLGANPSDWACTRDNVTGLVWEVKTNDSGLRDKHWTYTWYDANPATNGGNAGTRDGGDCFEEITRDCDTQGYIQDLNATALCGFSDWRMPTIEELRSIVDYGRSDPAIDTTFFPNTRADTFWTAYTSDILAGFIVFNVGAVFEEEKRFSLLIRLVRGGQ